jgi:hypothetical protein
MTLAKRPLRQRVIALGIAYTIALAGLVANFGAARAAADAIAQPDNAICHRVVADQPAPAPDGTGNAICADCCCVGCLTLMADVPLPSAKIVAVPQSSSQCIALPAITVLAGGPTTKSHQSRAPPRVA